MSQIIFIVILRFFLKVNIPSKKYYDRVMRLLIGFLCGFIMIFDIAAQQDPQYSHYMFNQMAVNPGYAGSHEVICATVVHRQQWVGIEGAPITPVFTVTAPFKMLKQSHGVGLTVMSDRIGFHTDVSAGLAYALQLPLKFGSGKVGIGLSGTFLNKALSATWKIPGGSPENDPSIPNPNESVMGIDMGLGVYYRAEKVYLGLSSTHLLEPTLRYEEEGIKKPKHKLKRHYYAMTGCTLPLNNPAWEFAPSMMVISDGTASQFTANVNVLYNKKVWGGMGYRLNDAVIAMIGVDLFGGLKIGYAFDYTYTGLNKYFSSGGSHEVMVNYCFSLVRERAVKKYKSVRFL